MMAMLRTFVRYNKRGDVVATTRLELPEQLEHPFGDLAEGESVLELGPAEQRAKEVPLLELHENWKVNPTTKKLVRRRPGRRVLP
jgi:hypothetical protein